MQPYYQDSHISLFHGDCRTILPQLDAGSVQCCVTSPPYFGLRDYQGDHQIGLEATPRDYVAQMAGVFGDVWRVLREDATCWLNLGDSYNGQKNGNTNGGASSGLRRDGRSEISRQGSNAIQAESMSGMRFTKPLVADLKPKDLIGIPWRVAFALQDAGWYLRSAITWCKGNPMPESVQDRPTKATEQMFLLAKSERYFYDIEATRVLSKSLNGVGGFDESGLEVGWSASSGFPSKSGKVSLNNQWSPYLILAALLCAKGILVKERYELLGQVFDILKNPRCTRIGLSTLSVAVQPTSQVLSDVFQHIGIVITQGNPQTEAELWIGLLSDTRPMRSDKTTLTVNETRKVISKVITDAQIIRHTVTLDTLTERAVDVDVIQQSVALLDGIDFGTSRNTDGLVTESLLEQLNLTMRNAGVEELGSPRHNGRSFVGDYDTNYTTEVPTRNMRDWWLINTQPYKNAHFAVFPEKLIEPCVLAGCPERVCSACGAPWMRQVERLSDTVNLAEGQRQQIRHGGALSGGTQKVTLGVTDQVIRTTLGWQPSCTCNAATAPGIVLDPFAGSGTTGRVAKRLGRRAILIEQNEAYCELAAESLTQQVFDFA